MIEPVTKNLVYLLFHLNMLQQAICQFKRASVAKYYFLMISLYDTQNCGSFCACISRVVVSDVDGEGMHSTVTSRVGKVDID